MQTTITRRACVTAAEDLLGGETAVLDRGFVRLVDYLGGDSRVVQSARVSYGAGTKTVREDRGLIDYLMRNAHTSPFEQVSLVFHVKLPLFVFAQLVRTRTAKLNSKSARYSVMEAEFWTPAGDELRAQSTTNKQVGEGAVENADDLALVFAAVAEGDHAIYEGLLEQGVAREQAARLLPQTVYTEIYWKIDLHNLMHFLRLRLDEHAQQEIRVYAEAMYIAAKAVAPMCVEAFDEHVLHGARFSRSELDALRDLIKMHAVNPFWRVAAAGRAKGMSDRQAGELVAKLFGKEAAKNA